MNKFLPVFTFLAAMVLSLPTHAQDKQDIDYTKLESIGLLNNEDSNSLGAGVYSQSNRSELVFLLKNINRVPWVNLQSSIKNLLITTADSAAINNDIDIIAGHDLLTLRITALLRMGYNQEAFELYSKTSDHTLDEPLIRAGIFSMLLNKQKALACLEIKTSFDKYKNITFWKELNAFCTLSLSKEENPELQSIIDQSQNKMFKSILEDKNFRLEYDYKTFSSLSFLERAILTAEDRIILPRSSIAHSQKTHPQHVAVLLQQTNIGEDTKAHLGLNAVEYDIQNAAFLSTMYKEILEKYTDNPPNNSDWYKLAVLYDETKAGWIPKKRKDKIVEAFAIADKYSDVALLPFLPAIQNMDIGQDLSLAHALRATKLFLFSELSPSEDWLEQLTNLKYEKKSEENLRLKLITALSLIIKDIDEELQEKVQKSLKTYLDSNQKTAALKNIIENIDSTQNNGDKVRYVDTNGFDLVWNNRYTMPPYVFMKALDQSSKNQDISVSLLLSAYTLSKMGNENVYAGILGDIVSALHGLGLKQLSNRIMAQAVLTIEN